jgi:hypothetical protein
MARTSEGRDLDKTRQLGAMTAFWNKKPFDEGQDREIAYGDV